MKQVSFLVISFFSLIFLFTGSVEAKVLPQAKSTVQKTTPQKNTTATGTSINVSPKLRSDRRALIVSFSNLQNASAVSYSLTYGTSTQDEGAMGSLNLKSNSSTNELLFGTCSKNVCRYHTGIKNAKLDVSYTLKSGKKFIKRYKIKV